MPSYLIFLDFVTWIVFGEEYRAYSSTLCRTFLFLHWRI